MWEKGKTVQDVLDASEWTGLIEDEPDDCGCGDDSLVQAKGIPAQNDRLVDAVMESITGVSAEWLAPARPAFASVMSMAMNESIDDEKVIKAIGELAESMPELFDSLDQDALRGSLESAMGAAAANGAFDRLQSFTEEFPDDRSANRDTENS